MQVADVQREGGEPVGGWYWKGPHRAGREIGSEGHSVE